MVVKTIHSDINKLSVAHTGPWTSTQNVQDAKRTTCGLHANICQKKLFCGTSILLMIGELRNPNGSPSHFWYVWFLQGNTLLKTNQAEY